MSGRMYSCFEVAIRSFGTSVIRKAIGHGTCSIEYVEIRCVALALFRSTEQ